MLETILQTLGGLDGGMAAVVVFGVLMSYAIARISVGTKPYAEAGETLSALLTTALFAEVYGFPIGVYAVWRYESTWSWWGFIVWLLCAFLGLVAKTMTAMAQKHYEAKETILYAALKVGASVGGEESPDVDSFLKRHGDLMFTLMPHFTGLLAPVCTLGLVYLLVHGRIGWAVLGGMSLLTAVVEIAMWRAIQLNRPFVARVRLDSEVIEKAIVFHVGSEHVRFYAPNCTRLVNRDRVISIDVPSTYRGKEANIFHDAMEAEKR